MTDAAPSVADALARVRNRIAAAAARAGRDPAAVTLVAVIALRETVGISLRSIDEADREALARKVEA